MLKVGVPGFTQVPQLLVYNLFYGQVQVGVEPEGSWQSAGSALQPEAACRARQVNSRHIARCAATRLHGACGRTRSAGQLPLSIWETPDFKSDFFKR